MKKLLVAAVLAVVSLCSTGCAAQTVAAPSSTAVASAGKSLATLTTADLDAAIAQANAAAATACATAPSGKQCIMQKANAACFTALETNLPAAPAVSAPVGVFSAFESASVVANNFSGDLIPPAVHVACAPVTTSILQTGVALGLIAAGAPGALAAGAPIAAAVKSSLPIPLP